MKKIPTKTMADARDAFLEIDTLYNTLRDNLDDLRIGKRTTFYIPASIKHHFKLTQSVFSKDTDADMISRFSDGISSVEQERGEKKAAFYAEMAPLTAALDEVQKHSRVRTIKAEDVLFALAAADKHLNMISSKKDAIGTELHFDLNGQAFPSAYKGKPESTWVTAKRTTSGWTIQSLYRDTTACSDCLRFTLTESTKAHMADRLSTCSKETG